MRDMLAPPHQALRAIFDRLASQSISSSETRLLIRYHVALQTPSIIPIYLSALVGTEPLFCGPPGGCLEPQYDSLPGGHLHGSVSCGH
jgi:hypothetical protein